jgi:hypothetical protein
VSEHRRFCENCGTAIGDTTNFCPNCGAAQRPDPDVPTGPPPSPPDPGRISTARAPNVPPPPEQPQSHTMRNIAIALIVLIVLIALAGRACGSGGETSSGGSTTASESNTKEEAKKEKEKSKQNQETEVAIGQPVTAGDIEWTVTDALTVNELRQDTFGQFGESKQGNFVWVDLLFTNNGSEPSTLTTQSLALLDSSDRESRPDTDTFGYIENERNIFLEQVNPGVTREGTAIFTVSPNASGFRLRVGDANMFSSAEAYVDLGF